MFFWCYRLYKDELQQSDILFVLSFDLTFVIENGISSEGRISKIDIRETLIKEVQTVVFI